MKAAPREQVSLCGVNPALGFSPVGKGASHVGRDARSRATPALPPALHRACTSRIKAGAAMAQQRTGAPTIKAVSFHPAMCCSAAGQFSRCLCVWDQAPWYLNPGTQGSRIGMWTSDRKARDFVLPLAVPKGLHRWGGVQATQGTHHAKFL